MPELTVIVPTYNEEQNLPVLYERLQPILDSLNLPWEWLVVDDHSSDGTFAVISALAEKHDNIRAVRLSRNCGSFVAIQCGFERARGRAVIVLAADLQDPPETIPRLVEEWKQGAQVVWAARNRRLGEKSSTILFSRLYYWIMRRFVGLRQMPAMGADFFLLDHSVVSALRRVKEINISLLPLISWIGYQQKTIYYDKQPRLHGHSHWNLEKKLKLLVDSVTSFTYLPIRLMSCLGFLISFLGILYAAVIVLNPMIGRPVPGWSSLMVVILVLGGMQMLMMGVLGEYLWRALDEARGRPKYFIENAIDAALPEPDRTPVSKEE